MITWVIGSGGLFGQALTRHCYHRFEPGPIPWNEPAEASRTLHHYGRIFESYVHDEPWQVIWAAGAATTTSSKQQAAHELHLLESVLTGLKSALPRTRGSFFLTSSAGGVYAGSSQPPFDQNTHVAPLSPYGELKIAQEQLVIDLLGDTTPVIIGRVSNLYGPGQNLRKLQGIISKLVLATILKEPVSIFVPLNTLRDYIYSDDAARIAIGWLDQTMQQDQPSAKTVVIASGLPTSIGSLTHLTESIVHSRVPVALGSHPSAAAQAIDLRVIPTPLTNGGHIAMTPLPAGLRLVYLDILQRFQTADLIPA